MIQLLIQRPLIRTGQMSVILTAHIMLLLVDGPEIAPVLACLTPREFPLPAFLVDPSLLIIDTAIDLVYAGMIGDMLRLMTRALGKSGGGDHQCDSE